MTKIDASKDYYEVFGLSPSASEAELRTRHKELALKLHPDKNPESERKKYDELYSDLSDAYEVLKNPDQRKKYDEQRSQLLGTTQTAPQAHQPFTTTTRNAPSNNGRRHNAAGGPSNGQRTSPRAYVDKHNLSGSGPKARSDAPRGSSTGQKTDAQPYAEKNNTTDGESRTKFSSVCQNDFWEPSASRHSSPKTERPSPAYPKATNKANREVDVSFIQPQDSNVFLPSKKWTVYTTRLSVCDGVWLFVIYCSKAVILGCLKAAILYCIVGLWHYRQNCQAPSNYWKCIGKEQRSCGWRQVGCSWKATVDYITSGRVAVCLKMFSTLLVVLILRDILIIYRRLTTEWDRRERERIDRLKIEIEQRRGAEKDRLWLEEERRRGDNWNRFWEANTRPTGRKRKDKAEDWDKINIFS